MHFCMQWFSSWMISCAVQALWLHLLLLRSWWQQMSAWRHLKMRIILHSSFHCWSTIICQPERWASCSCPLWNCLVQWVVHFHTKIYLHTKVCYRYYHYKHDICYLSAGEFPEWKLYIQTMERNAKAHLSICKDPLIDWISDTRPQGCTDLQSPVKCLDRR